MLCPLNCEENTTPKPAHGNCIYVCVVQFTQINGYPESVLEISYINYIYNLNYETLS